MLQEPKISFFKYIFLANFEATYYLYLGAIGKLYSLHMNFFHTRGLGLPPGVVEKIVPPGVVE